MIIYIDSNYKCHSENAEGRTAIETDFFDGKCTEFIEGYRFVPAGQTWTRSDGVIFSGEMIAPWKDYAQLTPVQTFYEIKEAQKENEKTMNDIAALLIEMMYQSDMEVIG